ncbi:DUF6123 family protein [Aquibacillus albus]|uniref:Uncharacterized protein n=1 Tax=Aquibacillus albus TaxID=1168171 RepID=A0ABS2MVF4_9BACI|nr:DUF6123 family protein [Aquibacillus albus]MBM7569876.1 hypothetical protein [Aquibacillus albus]
MNNKNRLANYLEDLWTKGFKLNDDQVRFIYFGKKLTNAPDWKVILSLKTTLQFQQTFDGSFYISLLELLNQEAIYSTKEAYALLKEKGFA